VIGNLLLPQNGPLQIMSVIPNCRAKADFTPSLFSLLLFGLRSHYPLFPLRSFKTSIVQNLEKERQALSPHCQGSICGGGG